MKRKTIICLLLMTVIILLSIQCVYYKHNQAIDTSANIMTTSIIIPEGYNYYTPDHISFFDCINNHTTEKNVQKSFVISNPDEVKTIIIVPQNERFNSPDYSISVIVEPYYCGKDYINMTWDEFDQEIISLPRRKFSFANYQVAETENVRYVIFTPTNEKNTKVFASIIKGRQIYFIAHYKGETISNNENELLYDIALSVELY